MAVQNRDERLKLAGTEPRLESLDGLRRERNFRHEHNGAFALLQRMFDGLEINLGLAGTGDAVEKGKELFCGWNGRPACADSASRQNFLVEGRLPPASK